MRIMGRCTKGIALAVVTAVIAALGMLGGAQVASASMYPPVIASYDGGTINLSEGWGTATICAVTNSGTNCFAAQAEYQSWLSSQDGIGLVTPLTDCSSNLELYQNEAYGGDELILSATLIWINLSDYSFADETSSYKVGACDIDMTDGTNGSGDLYPGATSAGSDVPWIGAAWNDRVQSVYIY